MTTQSYTKVNVGARAYITFFSILFILLTFPINAMAEAGKIIFIIGEAMVISPDEGSKKAKRGMVLEAGDTIRTTTKGQVQIRMRDRGLIAVRPDSEFKIEEFVYNQDVDTDKNFFSLVKGGFRSVTGAIGEANKAAYKVDTPVATIGIRGTDYTAQLCDLNCEADDGLYIGVTSGGVVLTNDAGSVDIDPAEFGYVPDMESDPVLLDEAPGEVLFSKVTNDSTQNSEQVAANDSNNDQTNNVVVSVDGSSNSDTLNFNNVSNDTVIEESNSSNDLVADEALVSDTTTDQTDVTEPSVDETLNNDESIEPVLYRGISVAGIDKSPLAYKMLTESVTYGTDGNLDSFKITNTSGSVYEFARDTAIAAVDTNSTSNNEVSWGRWTNMNVTMTDDSGTNSIELTDANSLHWAISNEHEEVILPSSGTFTYDIVGGTSPTDNHGGIGDIGASSQLGSVDFANQTAQLNISVLNMVDPEDEFASYNWSLNYDMAIRSDGTMYSTNDTMNPILMAVSGHAGSNFQAPTGSAQGSFAGYQADGAPTAAVISYEASRTYDKWMSAGTIDYQIRGIVGAELQP